MGQQMGLLPAQGLRVLLPGGGRSEFLGRKIGRERHLGVDHELLLAGELHDEVGPDTALRPGAVLLAAVDLLMEIDMAQHPGRLDHAAQLDFPPLAAGAVGPQRGLQGMG